jgi:DNA-binding response OmpR family regulator
MVVTFPTTLDTPESLIRALVVASDPGVRTSVERMLRDAGCDTLAAQDDLSARDLVIQFGPPDLVVTDEPTSPTSGHDFARWLRTCHAGVKVVYLTPLLDVLRV